MFVDLFLIKPSNLQEDKYQHSSLTEPNIKVKVFMLHCLKQYLLKLTCPVSRTRKRAVKNSFTNFYGILDNKFHQPYFDALYEEIWLRDG